MSFLHKNFKKLQLLTLSLLLSNICASIEYEPKKEEAERFFKEGFIFYNEARYSEALSAFKEAVKRVPDKPRYLYWLGKTFYRMGRLSECADTWSTLLKIEKNPWVLRKLEKFLFPLIPPHKRYYEKIGSIEGRILKKGRFFNPTSFCMDSAENMYIVSLSGAKIQKFSNAMDFIKSIKGFLAPISMAFDDEENALILDFKENALFKMDKKGKILWKKGGKGAEDGRLLGPEEVLFEDGYIWIVDSANARIQRWDKEGNFLLSFGKRGGGEAHFLYPNSLCLLGEEVWITDLEKRCVKKFDRWGNFFLSIDLVPHTPTDIQEWKGDLYISTKEGKFLRFSPSLHTIEVIGEEENALYHDLFINPNGLFYLSDFEGDKIDVYAPQIYKDREFDVFVEKVYWGAYPRICLWTRVRVGGRDIKGLGPQNFKVIEDGRRMFPLHVGEAKGSLYIILMDTNERMRPFEENVKMVASTLIKQLSPNEAAAIITYGPRVDVLVPPTFNKSKLLYRLRRINYSKRNDPYTFANALFEATKCFGNLGCKRIILVFTCKEDESPLLNNAINNLYTNIVPVCIIDYNEDRTNPMLERIVDRTKGTYIHAHTHPEYERVIEKIKEILEEQHIYVVTYETPKTSWKGTFCEVDVASGYFGLYAEDKEGYIVP